MSEQIPALPPPARTDGASARPAKDGDAPPGGFAEVLGAAETATSPPTPSTRPARTAHAEGTKAEGDSSGLKHPAPPELAATHAAELVAAAALPVDPTPIAAPVPSTPPERAARRVATTNAETGRPIRSTIAKAVPGQPPAEAATTTLQPKTNDAVKPPARDGGITPPAPPETKSGGHRVRPSRPHQRQNHMPIEALKDDAERPLREFAVRTTPAATAVAHRIGRTAPTAAPATIPAPVAATASPPSTSPGAARTTLRPPQVRVHELAESMHAVVKVANRRGTAAARITLRPAELGGVQVQLRSHAGGVSASLTAETRAGAEALGVSYGELRRTLEAQGIVVHAIDVQLAGGGLGPDGRGERWQSPAQQMGASVRHDDDDQDETTIEPSRLPDSGAQIDVLA
jgi:flagellar hook-length control protein FliK